MLDTWIVRCTHGQICGQNPIRGCEVVHPGSRRCPQQACPQDAVIALSIELSGGPHCGKPPESPGIAEIIAKELSLMGVRNQLFSIRRYAIAPIGLAIVAGVSILAAPAAAQAQGAV
ncbi:MAG: hypothetical protein ACRCV5_02735, partial [Afipia sp.]